MCLSAGPGERARFSVEYQQLLVRRLGRVRHTVSIQPTQPVPHCWCSVSYPHSNTSPWLRVSCALGAAGGRAGGGERVRFARGGGAGGRGHPRHVRAVPGGAGARGLHSRSLAGPGDLLPAAGGVGGRGGGIGVGAPLPAVLLPVRRPGVSLPDFPVRHRQVRLHDREQNLAGERGRHAPARQSEGGGQVQCDYVRF